MQNTFPNSTDMHHHQLSTSEIESLTNLQIISDHIDEKLLNLHMCLRDAAITKPNDENMIKQKIDDLTTNINTKLCDYKEGINKLRMYSNQEIDTNEQILPRIKKLREFMLKLHDIVLDYTTIKKNTNLPVHKNSENNDTKEFLQSQQLSIQSMIVYEEDTVMKTILTDLQVLHETFLNYLNSVICQYKEFSDHIDTNLAKSKQCINEAKQCVDEAKTELNVNEQKTCVVV